MNRDLLTEKVQPKVAEAVLEAYRQADKEKYGETFATIVTDVFAYQKEHKLLTARESFDRMALDPLEDTGAEVLHAVETIENITGQIWDLADVKERVAEMLKSQVEKQ